MKAILTIIVISVLSLTVSAQVKPQVQPEEVAKAYVEATRTADWLKCAGLMHPDVLKQVHDLLEPIVDIATKGKEGGKELEMGLGIKDKAEFNRLSGQEVFARFLGLLTRVSPEMKNVLGSSSFEIIGQVPEQPDLVHVVYRMKIRLPAPNVKEPLPFTKLNVMTLRRFEDTWRMELSGDLRGVIQAMAANLAGALLEESRETPPVQQQPGRKN